LTSGKCLSDMSEKNRLCGGFFLLFCDHHVQLKSVHTLGSTSTLKVSFFTIVYTTPTVSIMFEVTM
jgi:hypothetical protein